MDKLQLTTKVQVLDYDTKNLMNGEAEVKWEAQFKWGDGLTIDNIVIPDQTITLTMEYYDPDQEDACQELEMTYEIKDCKPYLMPSEYLDNSISIKPIELNKNMGQFELIIGV